MKIFLTTLTLYTYENEDERINLNKEESEKFIEGARNAGDYQKMIVFSDYSMEEFEELVTTLPEGESFSEVLSIIKSSDFKWIKTDLINYENSYVRIYKVMEDILVSWSERGYENLHIYMNLSCGHKIGSLSLYMAVLNLVHGEYYGYLSRKKGRYIRIRPYHSERSIVEELPVMNFHNESNPEYEKYIGYLLEPMKIEEFKKAVRKDEALVKNFGDKVIMHLRKRGYISSKDGIIVATKKGRTLYYVLKKLGEI